jgi:hypothetical protein
MIRLLWLFLICDVAWASLFAAADILGSQTAGAKLNDSGMRVLFEIATLAIIQTIREKKV